MNATTVKKIKGFLSEAQKMKMLVVGDVMLDRFVWGRVSRISPEAPVPIVDYDHESVMPGGAANVARNLTALGAPSLLFGAVGRDETARSLKSELKQCMVGCEGLLDMPGRMTSVKTRIIAHRQQVVRVDRETKSDLDDKSARRLLAAIDAQLDQTDAVIVGDYGKGSVTQFLLDGLKQRCRERGIWLSLDPKPVHRLDLTGLSLITPNRKEAFELAGIQDDSRATSPLEDSKLMQVAATLLGELKPAVLLITLGDQGMLLCQSGRAPFHMPTVAREVFDVSGAGDTVIASFTLAIAAGASPQEAVLFSNHAAGVVVGKLGTATVTPEELTASFHQT